MATVYLSSPGNQMQASYLGGMPVLVSFALLSKWLGEYIPTFGQTMVDSGAYSEMSSGKVVDLDKYGQWLDALPFAADAAAALDDIRGDWERSLYNWDQIPQTFPVLHDSDPPNYIDAVLERLQDSHRGRLRPTDAQWCGIGLVPPRTKTAFVERLLKRIPSGVHVHLFAMRNMLPQAMAIRGNDVSADSINWVLDSFAVKNKIPWLTLAECTEIVVKRYQRCPPRAAQTTQGDLFDENDHSKEV